MMHGFLRDGGETTHTLFLFIFFSFFYSYALCNYLTNPRSHSVLLRTGGQTVALMSFSLFLAPPPPLLVAPFSSYSFPPPSVSYSFLYSDIFPLHSFTCILFSSLLSYFSGQNLPPISCYSKVVVFFHSRSFPYLSLRNFSLSSSYDTKFLASVCKSLGAWLLFFFVCYFHSSSPFCLCI